MKFEFPPPPPIKRQNQNPLAQKQNPLAPGYRTQLSLHAAFLHKATIYHL